MAIQIIPLIKSEMLVVDKRKRFRKKSHLNVLTNFSQILNKIMCNKQRINPTVNMVLITIFIFATFLLTLKFVCGILFVGI